jgi:hypothetical protein
VNARIDFFCEGIFVNLRQYEVHALLCLGIMLKTNDTSLEQIRYISHCNDVAFNIYDLGNLLY